MDKKIIIGIVAVLVLFLGVGGFLYFKSQGSGGDETSEEESLDANLKELQPEDIGLTAEINAKKDGMNMRITKLDGIESIDYEATYDAEVKDGKEILTTTKGFGPSTIEIEPGDTEIVRDDLLFGTCSKNVCTYDKVVSDITFNVRVNYKDGTVGSIEMTIPY